MRITTHRFATIVILLTSLLLSPVTLMGQAGTSDWSRLNSVASGSKLSVKLRNGKNIDGTFSGVSDTSLTLMVKNTSTEVKRDDILSVHSLNGTSTKKSTLIGLGVGAGVGAVLGIAADASSGSGDFGGETLDNAVAGAITVIGAGVGALTGFLIGKTGKKKVLIYEAK
jgi:hypothetical protein